MWFRFIIFACLTSLTTAASAADGIENSSENLHWRCWYDQQVHITCLVDTASKADSATLAALPGNLPSIVKTMRANPASLRGKIVHIPLHSEPLDMDFTALLAQATVCGSRRDCSVNFTEKLPPTEEVVALLNKHLPGQEPATILAMLGDDLDDLE